MTSGRKLPPETIAALREHYLFGSTHAVAAAALNVSPAAVNNYFARFRADGLTRGKVHRKAYALARRYDPEVRPYTGPAMIGQACSAFPVPVGPDWIGKRA